MESDTKREIEYLKQRVCYLEEKLAKCNSFYVKRSETFYQKYLEDKLGASHTKNKYGVTDIETEDTVIEIKSWKDFKGAIGQLFSYTKHNHKQKKVYFFGETPSSQKVNEIVTLLVDHNIDVYTLNTNIFGDVIENRLLPTPCQVFKENLFEMNASFVTSYLHKGGQFVRWTELLSVYQTWYEEETGQTCETSKKHLKNYFENFVFKAKEQPVKGVRGWIGWSIVPKPTG